MAASKARHCANTNVGGNVAKYIVTKYFIFNSSNLKLFYIFIGLTLSLEVLSQSQAQQRKDSLMNTHAIHDDRYVPTGYVFDSLLILNKKNISNNLELIKSAKYGKINSISKDSTLVFYYTGKTIILNGRILTQNDKPIYYFNCECIGIEIVNRKKLMKMMKVDNINGAILVYCQ
ncbi:MAG: hypothetical protein O9294_12205 [Cytophagales bacterium]|nr:hypothetical protein [Cytophagales bacterium]